MKKILKIHEKLNHRKINLREIIDAGYILSENLLKNIIKKCDVCTQKDKRYYRNCSNVQVKKHEDRLGLDILELVAGNKILMAIDYFSQKIFSMSIKTKTDKK